MCPRRVYIRYPGEALLLVIKVVRVVFLYVHVESAGENVGDLSGTCRELVGNMSETNVGDKTCHYYDR